MPLMPLVVAVVFAVMWDEDEADADDGGGGGTARVTGAGGGGGGAGACCCGASARYADGTQPCDEPSSFLASHQPIW